MRPRTASSAQAPASHRDGHIERLESRRREGLPLYKTRLGAAQLHRGGGADRRGRPGGRPFGDQYAGAGSPSSNSPFTIRFVVS